MPTTRLKTATGDFSITWGGDPLHALVSVRIPDSNAATLPGYKPGISSDKYSVHSDGVFVKVDPSTISDEDKKAISDKIHKEQIGRAYRDWDYSGNGEDDEVPKPDFVAPEFEQPLFESKKHQTINILKERLEKLTDKKVSLKEDLSADEEAEDRGYDKGYKQGYRDGILGIPSKV